MGNRAFWLILGLAGFAWADTGTTPVNIVKISSQTYITVSDTYSIPVSAVLTPPALTTITVNGIAQQVTSTYTVVTDTFSLPVSVTVNSGPISIVPVSGSTITVGYQSGLSSVPVQVQNLVNIGGSAATVNADGGINVHSTNGGSGGTSSNFGSAFPSAGTAAGWVGPGTLMQGAAVTSSSNPIVAISGSSNTVSVGGSTLAVTNVSGANLNINIAAGSIGNSGFNVNNAPTVVQSTAAVNGSTIGVVNAGNTSLTVAITSGSISNTGFNVNNSPTVIQSTAAVNGSTIAVTNGVGTQLTVVSTGIPVTSLTPLVVTGSTVGVISASPLTVTGSTVGVISVTPLTVTGSTVGVVGTTSNNGAAATSNRLGTLPGIAQNSYGNNGAAYTQGRDAALPILSSSGLMGVWSGPDISFNSYSGSTNTFTITIATQDISALCGNANKTVYVYGARMSCTQTTAGNFNLSIVKRSAAYTGAWSTMTTTPQDANYGVAQSTAIFITGANVTNGALVGHLDNYQLGCMAAATATPNDIYIAPSSWKMKPIVLRGTSQCVGMNIENASLSGGKFTAQWEWMEVTSP